MVKQNNEKEISLLCLVLLLISVKSKKKSCHQSPQRLVVKVANSKVKCLLKSNSYGKNRFLREGTLRSNDNCDESRLTGALRL